MTTMNIVTMWLDLLGWVYQSFSMPLVKKIWLQTNFQIQWVCFFRYHDSNNVTHSKRICSQIFTYVQLTFWDCRKPTLFEIIWKTSMRYQSHACFGHGRSGVNMLANLRFGSIKISIYSNLNHFFTFFSPISWFSDKFVKIEALMVKQLSLRTVMLSYSWVSFWLFCVWLSNV